MGEQLDHGRIIKTTRRITFRNTEEALLAPLSGGLDIGEQARRVHGGQS